jgi:hypothetical protein
MTTATITSKGQVTIPKDVRTRLGIGTGDPKSRMGSFRSSLQLRMFKSLKALYPGPKRLSR